MARTPPPQLPAPLPDLSHHVHILILSFTGVIYSPTDSVLRILGIHGSDLDRLLRSLHLHSVHLADTILRSHRRLEYDPLTFAHSFSPHTRTLPRPPPPHDPP